MDMWCVVAKESYLLNLMMKLFFDTNSEESVKPNRRITKSHLIVMAMDVLLMGKMKRSCLQ